MDESDNLVSANFEIKYIVYALIDPRDGQVRYVGKTIHGLERIEKHRQNSKNDTSIHKKRWVSSLHRRGLDFSYKILIALPNATYLDDAEKYWIFYFKSIGCDLTNLTNGGGGLLGYKFSDEARAKMTAWQKGVPKPQWLKDKISKGLTGKKSAKKGRPLSESELAAHAASHQSPSFKDQHGNIYTSLKEVQDKYGIPKGNVHKVLNGLRKSAGGLEFSYLNPDDKSKKYNKPQK